MNILYLTYSDFDNKDFIGVNNKIYNQVKSMNAMGNKANFIYRKGNTLYYSKGNNKIYKFKNKYDFMFNQYKSIFKILDKDNIECVYIRYSLIDIFFIKFIKNVYKRGIKIYLEIPTFPYDNELSYKGKVIDKICRNFIHRYINAIIVSSCKIDKIFGVKSIFIDNCVDVKNIDFIERDFINDEINIIAVSYIRKTNGYDRFIQGLIDYYNSNGNRIINVNFIGNGEEIYNLKSMVIKNNLQDRVKFLGSKVGKDLDKYYKKADLAIGSLGDHRDNIFLKSPLKSREYCARGIPFMSAVEDLGFQEKEDFILKFDPNETSINIKKVIQYYDSLRNKNISKLMREYALQNFNWIKQYEKISEFNEMKGNNKIYE